LVQDTAVAATMVKFSFCLHRRREDRRLRAAPAAVGAAAYCARRRCLGAERLRPSSCSAISRNLPPIRAMLSRVDCRGLPWGPQTVFGILPTFFRRGHDDNPTCEPHQAPYRSGPTAPSCLIVSDSVLDNAQHAEEARTIAEKLSDPQSRRTMLRIAEDYERPAAHAERLAKRTETA